MPPDEDPEPRVPVNFRLHPAERDQVDAIAARQQRSRSQMIRYWVIEAINRDNEGNT